MGAMGVMGAMGAMGNFHQSINPSIPC